MGYYRLKRWKNGKERRARIDAKAEFSCPDYGQKDASGWGHHDRPYHAGDKYVAVISDTTETVSEDATGKVTRQVIVRRRGKVAEDSLPICRHCGATYVKKGYRFVLTDEYHDRGHTILGFARDATDDKTIEDRYFATAKAARRHLDTVIKRMA